MLRNIRQRKTTIKIVDIEKTNVKLSRKLLLNFRTKTDRTQLFNAILRAEEKELSILFTAATISDSPLRSTGMGCRLELPPSHRPPLKA